MHDTKIEAVTRGREVERVSGRLSEREGELFCCIVQNFQIKLERAFVDRLLNMTKTREVRGGSS